MKKDILHDLPSTFYRAAVKCLIFNEARELLVLKSDDGGIEIPGGGWEQNETLEECAQRELMEELGVRATTVGQVAGVLQGKSDKGWGVLRIVVPVELESTDFTFTDPEIISAFYVSPESFEELNFCAADAPFAQAADLIWPTR